MADIEKKYDDIFDSVVKRALSYEPLSTINALSRTKVTAGRKKYNSLSISSQKIASSRKLRSISESDSLGSSDVSQDSDDSMSPPALDTDGESTELIFASPNPCASCLPYGYIACECGRHFPSHLDVHRHMATEHSPSAQSACSQCGTTAKWLRRHNVCRICRKFVEKRGMDDHIKSHYQDKTGPRPLMECRCCYRSFSTIKEVREHERVHQTRLKNRRIYTCTTCRMEFNARHKRDKHMVEHFDEDVWEKVQAIIEQAPGLSIINQCPMCPTVMRTRKSFKLHVLHHFLRQPSLLASFGISNSSFEMGLIGQKSCKQEPMELKEEFDVEHQNCTEFPVTVKEEPVDSE